LNFEGGGETRIGNFEFNADFTNATDNITRNLEYTEQLKYDRAIEMFGLSGAFGVSVPSTATTPQGVNAS
jgi:hypothetical protein